MDALVQVSPDKVKYWGRICLIAVPMVNVVSCTLPKLVILAVYLRIFVQKPSRIACYATGVVLVAACVINVVLSIWQCSPADYVWNKTIVNGYCRDSIQAHVRWGQFPNIVTDIALLILPMVRTFHTNVFTRLMQKPRRIVRTNNKANTVLHLTQHVRRRNIDFEISYQPIVWKLQVSPKAKIGLATTIAVGSV